MKRGHSREAASPSALLYCHDTFGLGHLRRTVAIAAEFRRRRPDVSQLIATGSPIAHAFRLPRGVDYLKLPSVVKTGADGYASRTLPLELQEIVALRRELLTATVRHLRPSLVLVDNVPGGLAGELVPALRELRRAGGARLVLGLRDIVDEASRVRRAWTRDGSYALIEDVYDRIIVYGERALFDPVREYAFSDIAAEKTRFVGYLPRTASVSRASVSAWQADDSLRRVLVTVGGGQDGEPLLQTALAARRAQAPDGTAWLIVTGPLLEPAARVAVERLASGLAHTRVIEFVDDLAACIATADVVVSMGGYNSVCEILTARRPAVIVPRVEPRVEQLLRARALEGLGIVRVVHPDDLTPRVLDAHVRSLLASAERLPERLELRGLACAVAELDDLLRGSPSPTYALTGNRSR